MAKERKPGVARRFADGAMGLGVMILLGGLVSAFVVVFVVLVNPVGGDSQPAVVVEGSAASVSSNAYRALALQTPSAATPNPADISVTPAEKKKKETHRPAPAAMDDKGYIRRWLVLGPIPCDKENEGKREVGRDQIKGESRVTPKAGEKQKTRKGDLVWKEHHAPEYFVDFRKAAQGRGEDVVGFAVCYLKSARDVKDLRLEMKSNDQARVYLNGKRLLNHTDTRTLESGTDVAKNVRLKKGDNVLVLKVVNEKNNWHGAVRLTDEKGRPYRDVEISLKP